MPLEGVAVPTDVEIRFVALTQSPLRATLLRFLHARADRAYDVDALMAACGHMRLDVENCVVELVDAGVVEPGVERPDTFRARRPADPTLGHLLAAFLEDRAAGTREEQASSVQRFRDLIGRDERMLAVFEGVRTAAKSDISVLVLGPTGSGKELVARMIHELSRRGRESFQPVACAALQDTLFESEIFGHEPGAFTGADGRKLGRIELADKGTLFLDEIADLSPSAQAKLLRVLEERRIERLGGSHPVLVDFRLISATNQGLEERVRDGLFREDLYYRMNAFVIRLPSLRERPADIPILAARLVRRYCFANALPAEAKVLSREALARLRAYSWPGNVRELESTLSRAALLAPDRVIRREDIVFNAGAPAPGPGAASLPTLAEMERAHIARVLDAVAWNKKEAARVLRISRGTLYRKIVEHRLAPSSTAQAS